MSDLLYNFPTTGLALALDGLAALRADVGDSGPLNALGDPRDPSGAIVAPGEPVVWIGRPGSPATSYEGMDGKSVDVPAKGDPGRYYVHIRTGQNATARLFDAAAYGLVPTDPYESAMVLGVWAGDDVPAARRNAVNGKRKP